MSVMPDLLRLDGVRAGYGATVVLEDIALALPERGSLALLPELFATGFTMNVAALAGAVFVVDRVQRRRVIGKERERSQFREAQLRADAAEALARSERERTAREAADEETPPPPVPRHYETVLDAASFERWMQAIERAGTKDGNKGRDAALSAIEMANLYTKV